MNGVKIDSVADTSAIICLSRQDQKATVALRGRSFALTFVTMAELLIGIYKAQDPEMAYRKIEPIIRGKRILYSSEKTLPIYARACSDLERRGKRIPSNDLWIADLAMEMALPLVARDEHFGRIDGLSVIAC